MFKVCSNASMERTKQRAQLAKRVAVRPAARIDLVAAYTSSTLMSLMTLL
jgi:hypothetical protein